MTEAKTALAELTEISSQVQAAVIFDREGAVSGSTLPDDRAAGLASSARTLLEEAERVNTGAELAQLEAATSDGSLFILRDGERLIAATTRPEPTAGLVFYDLKSCLRSAAEKPKPTAKRQAPARKPRKQDDAKS